MSSMWASREIFKCRRELIECRAPTSGGQYHWVFEFAPSQHHKVLSYVTGKCSLQVCVHLKLMSKISSLKNRQADWRSCRGRQSTRAVLILSALSFNFQSLWIDRLMLLRDGKKLYSWWSSLFSWSILISEKRELYRTCRIFCSIFISLLFSSWWLLSEWFREFKRRKRSSLNLKITMSWSSVNQSLMMSQINALFLTVDRFANCLLIELRVVFHRIENRLFIELSWSNSHRFERRCSYVRGNQRRRCDCFTCHDFKLYY
jgi:hypothetical protein